MIDIATIEGHLSQQGRFCLLDWLLSDNHLLYSDYEAWRYGQRDSLDNMMQFDQETLPGLLADAEKYCRELGLVADPQIYYRWNEDKKIVLVASEDDLRNQQLTQLWLRPQDQPQLDLFLDNSSQVAESALLEALGGRQFKAAQTLLQNFAELNSECGRLGGYQDLINYGLHILANARIEAVDLERELKGLKQEVRPLALDILGQRARDYLSFAWRRVAESLRGLPFDPMQPEYHTSFMLFQIPDYPAVIESLQSVENLYQHPVLLERLALSHGALHQNEAALLAWCQLMECDADFAEDSMEQHRWRMAYSLWQDFWEVSDDWSHQLFPAYVLARRADLIHGFTSVPLLRHPASQAMAELLRCRLEHRDEVSARATLRSISPELLAVSLGRR